jgi:transposase-like protein
MFITPSSVSRHSDSGVFSPAGSAAAAAPAALQADGEKKDGRCNNRGSNKRNRYTFEFKSGVLDACRAALMRGDTLESVAAEVGISRSSVSTWRKEAEDILAEAVDVRRKSAKCAAGAGRPPRWLALEKRLVADIQQYRRARAAPPVLLRTYAATACVCHQKAKCSRVCCCFRWACLILHVRCCTAFCTALH